MFKNLKLVYVFTTHESEKMNHDNGCYTIVSLLLTGWFSTRLLLFVWDLAESLLSNGWFFMVACFAIPVFIVIFSILLFCLICMLCEYLFDFYFKVNYEKIEKANQIFKDEYQEFKNKKEYEQDAVSRIKMGNMIFDFLIEVSKKKGKLELILKEIKNKKEENVFDINKTILNILNKEKRLKEKEQKQTDAIRTTVIQEHVKNKINKIEEQYKNL